jgi:hypothetical protein
VNLQNKPAENLHIQPAKIRLVLKKFAQYSGKIMMNLHIAPAMKMTLASKNKQPEISLAVSGACRTETHTLYCF